MIHQVVSDMLISGSSYRSCGVWVLRSHLYTLRDMRGNHAWQLIVTMRLKRLFSPTCNRLGLGEARSGLKKSLDLSMT